MKLPPWTASSQRDRERFLEWSISQLEALDAEFDAKDSEYPYDYSAYYDWMTSPAELHKERLARAKASALFDGNLKPLRKLYPEIAEFLHEPPRKRGQHRPRRNNAVWRQLYMDLVIDDVRRLREIIWPKHFGKWKRRRNDAPSAEAIAAARRGLTEDEVIEAIKLRSR
jgi:hypothetical protein